jgi:hypothetical protein
MSQCPKSIGNLEVVLYTAIDQRQRATGNCRHFVRGAALNPVNGLVIARERGEESCFLLYCDPDWRPLTDTWHMCLEDAKSQAEYEYAGVSSTWMTPP